MADEATMQDAAAQAAAQAAASAAPGQDAEQQTTEAPAVFDRGHPAFKAVTKQVEDERKAREALQAQLNEILDKERKAQEEAERKALEEKGQYDAILKQKESELAALKVAHERATLESEIKVRLFSAGASNDLFIEGAVARYGGKTDGVDDYIETLKSDERNAVFFGIQQEQPRTGIPPAQGGTPAASTNVDWRQIKQDLRDPKKAEAASAAITEFAKNNDGKLPPGF